MQYFAIQWGSTKSLGDLLVAGSLVLFLVWFDELAKARDTYKPKTFKGEDGKLYDRYKKAEDYPDASWIYHELQDNLRRLQFTLALAVIGLLLTIF